MIDQNAQLQDLPEFWQEKIRSLRSENHSLRTRLRATLRLDDQGLSPSWAKKLRKIRDENVQLRKERNALREELTDLRAELEA